MLTKDIVLLHVTDPFVYIISHYLHNNSKKAVIPILDGKELVLWEMKRYCQSHTAMW